MNKFRKSLFLIVITRQACNYRSLSLQQKDEKSIND